MRWVAAGASGFLGTALRDILAQRGHEVVQLVRGDSPSSSASRWDPYAGRVDRYVIESADVVVNLAGVTIAKAAIPAYRKRVRESRVATTRTLAEAVAEVEGERPVFLAQSAIGIYGDHGETGIGETASLGEGYVPQLVKDWEAAAAPAQAAGARVCWMRTAPVLDRRGGALPLMLPAFRLGLGARVGSGRQYFPVLSLEDWTSAVVFLAEQDGVEGPFNLSAPQPPTNAEFTAALARALHRPAKLKVPAVAVRAALRELSGEALGSLRVLPVALREAGFTFRHQTVDEVLDAALAR